MPPVYRGVKLHARITRDVGPLRNQKEHLPGLICLHHLSRGHSPGLPGCVIQHSFHKLIRNSDTVVGILKKDGSISLAIERAVIPRIDQGPYLFLLLRLAVDKFDDVRMIYIEDYHFSSSPSLTTRFNNTGKGIISLHERDRTRCSSTPGEMFLRGAKRREVCTRSRTMLEKHALNLCQFKDRRHGILDGIDKARRTLRLLFDTTVEPYRTVE